MESSGMLDGVAQQLASLTEEVERLRARQTENLHRLQEKERELLSLREKFTSTEQALKGLQAWAKHRRETSQETYALKNLVSVNRASGVEGRIEEIRITPGGILYLVSWFTDKVWHSHWLMADEVELVDPELLPLPKL